MTNTGKILIAFAAGAAVGTALGILFAPDKGSETRNKMYEKGKKMAESVKEKFRAGKEKFEEEMEEFA
jgi:gas vesicle protein